MKKWINVLFLCMVFFILAAFENADQLQITEITTMIDKENGLLRYEFQIINNGDEPIKSEFDYPGHENYGIEIVVQPKEALANLMVTDATSKHPKMQPLEKGWKEYFEPGKETPFYISYKIKEDADFSNVTKHALDADLLILDGTEISKRIHLQDYKKK